MKGRIIIIIILFLVALALFGAAFVYYYQGEYLPIVNKVITLPLVEKPSNIVIGNMLDNIKTVSTASYDLEAKSSWNAYGSPFELNTKILFNGRFEDKPRGKIKINNDIKIQNLTFLTSLEASLAENKVFFQITEVPALPFLDMKKIEDKWYEADWSFFNFGNFNLIYESMGNIFVVKDRLPDEIIDGTPSYHYLIGLDPAGHDTFYKLLPKNDLYQDIFKKENFEKIELELWISKNNMYLLKAETAFTNELINLELVLNISAYNEPISLEKPEQGYSLNILTKDLFAKTNILDITLFSYLVGIEDDYFMEDKDQDQLYLIWENLFGTNDNKIDTDNDGHQDIDEIKNGYNPSGQGKLLE